MTISPWKILETTYLLRDRWLTVRKDRCETPEGLIVDPYYVQESLDWAHVAAFDDNDRVLVTHQYRHGCGEVCMELPSGVIEAGEDPLDGIRRELLEETGAEVETIEALAPCSPNPARYRHRVHHFVATGAQIVNSQNLDESETIEFEFLPVTELLDHIRSGRMIHGLHIGTLYLALERLGRIKLLERR